MALAEDRDLADLKGMLTPPDLSSVGDKLLPDYLLDAIRGQAPTARPWLSVRMPRFSFADGEADSIAGYLREHDQTNDREGSDLSRKVGTVPDRPRPTDEQLESAARLMGQNGFGCVSCHVLAGKVPPGGEPETLGPDLALARDRMSADYFRRWISDPQRIIPGTPMPQFVTAISSEPGDLDDQLGRIWQLLESDRVSELTAYGTRQILRSQGDRAIAVRDMVLVPEAPGTYFPRAWRSA